MDGITGGPSEVANFSGLGMLCVALVFIYMYIMCV